jgi:heptosyltransferase-2
MCARLLKKSGPKRILVVSQTNIGDVVLTCPVIDILRRDFPQARIDVVTGPKAVSLFADNPDLCIKVFDKQAPLRQKFAWFLDLYQAHYDCVVDLRRTALAFFLAPKYSTPLIAVSWGAHKKDMHLNRLRQVYDFDSPSEKQYAVLTTKEDEQFFEGAVAPFLQGQGFIVIAPGAADSAKRWHAQGFAAVADHLSAANKIVFVGDAKDARIVNDIQGRMKTLSISLAGKINLRQLAFVLKKCSWVMTHDSGVMHLACYFNVPVVALWGPTDINKYAPWGSPQSVIVRRNEKCLRCRDPKSKGMHHCMSFIEVQDVINATSVIARSEATKQSQKRDYNENTKDF